MYSLALYYPNLENSGGIERVVVEQTRLFLENGYRCLLLTNIKPHFYKDRIKCKYLTLPTNGKNRNEEWNKIIVYNQINYVILNSAVDCYVLRDIDSIHEAGAKVINTIHFSFPCPLLFNEAWETFRFNIDVGKKCDAVATVNKLDAIWWKSLGCNAFHVLNPYTFYHHSNKTKDYNSHKIIWVGRDVPQKKPYEALQIIAEVSKQVPDIKLLMVGVVEGAYRKDIHKLGIANNVDIISPTNEIGKYYEQASIHLLTSITESFCLVVAEAKSYKIPTVMYNIPFVELVDDGKGVIIHEQSDIKGMANSIIELLNSPNNIQKMGEDAFDTLMDYNDENVISYWQIVFDSLEHEGNTPQIEIDSTGVIVREIYSAWMNHCRQNQWKIEFFDNIERATGHSAKRMISFISKIIIEPLKRLKRNIRLS